MKTKPYQHDILLSYGISDTVWTCGTSRPSDIARKHHTSGIVVPHCLKVYLGLKGERRSRCLTEMEKRVSMRCAIFSGYRNPHVC